jgi:hypothetical protein
MTSFVAYECFWKLLKLKPKIFLEICIGQLDNFKSVSVEIQISHFQVNTKLQK